MGTDGRTNERTDGHKDYYMRGVHSVSVYLPYQCFFLKYGIIDKIRIYTAHTQVHIHVAIIYKCIDIYLICSNLYFANDNIVLRFFKLLFIVTFNFVQIHIPMFYAHFFLKRRVLIFLLYE